MELSNLFAAMKELVGSAPDEAEIKANMKLNEAGSVMGSKKQAQAALDRSPVLSTINELLGSLNPVENIGAPGQAAFAPIRTAAQKKIVKGAYRVAPTVVEQVRDLPRKISVDAMRRGETALGIPSGTYSPSGGSVGIDPSVMRGQVPQSKLAQAFADAMAQMSGQSASSMARTGKNAGLGNLPVTAAHEFQHVVNNEDIIPKLLASGRYPKPTSILNPIAPVLSRGGAEEVIGAFNAGDPMRAVDEALAYLREAAISNPNDPTVQALTREFLGR